MAHTYHADGSVSAEGKWFTDKQALVAHVEALQAVIDNYPEEDEEDDELD